MITEIFERAEAGGFRFRGGDGTPCRLIDAATDAQSYVPLDQWDSTPANGGLTLRGGKAIGARYEQRK